MLPWCSLTIHCAVDHAGGQVRSKSTSELTSLSRFTPHVCNQVHSAFSSWAPDAYVRGHLLAEMAIDRADLLDPPAPIGVLQVEDLVQRPVKVVGDEGYLLLELFEGVAYDSPGALISTSTSN